MTSGRHRAAKEQLCRTSPDALVLGHVVESIFGSFCAVCVLQDATQHKLSVVQPDFLLFQSKGLQSGVQPGWQIQTHSMSYESF